MKRQIKQLFPGKHAAPTWKGLALRGSDTSGLAVERTMSLSTPIVSAQDGPRLMLKEKARKGGKRRKIAAAKARLAKGGADLSVLDTAERKALPASAFVFPSKRAYPIHDLAHARNALARSSGKPEEAVVRAAVYRKYPALRKG